MLRDGVLRVVGCMSGTSLDGVDAAELLTDGIAIHGFGPTRYRAYAPEERALLGKALGAWRHDPAAALVEGAHAEVLEGWDCDLVGFHGQTLAHDPGGRGTYQAGDGAQLAEALGRPVVWDFRSADVGMGGQGAPLAPFYHWACARWMGAQAPLAVLNLGGVGNLTWVDPAAGAPEAPGALLAFDTGPANAPLDDLMRNRTGAPCDRDGRRAARGEVDTSRIEAFLAHPFFQVPPPKSLDRGAFHAALPVDDMTVEDAAATLTAAIAASVASGIGWCPTPPSRVLVTGGGRRNPTLMAWLSEMLDCPTLPVEDVGLDGDMLEAQAFAYLAARVARGLPTSAPGTTGVRAPLGGGTISRP
ncbi:MAG: anhydro-N-acetylmuramic acid kinase [Shimia sp.]